MDVQYFGEKCLDSHIFLSFLGGGKVIIYVFCKEVPVKNTLNHDNCMFCKDVHICKSCHCNTFWNSNGSSSRVYIWL